ncbi:MAG: hypothetical protein ACR2MS_09290 [Weeksellaceae bacterium]
MKKEDKKVNPEVRKENSKLEEGAINRKATEGQEVNPKEVEKREQHQPRDKA